MTVQEEKARLRKIFLKKRCEITDKSEKDSIICEKIINSEHFKKAALILLYEPIKKEIDTKKLFESALLLNKKVAYPRCFDDGVMEFFEVSSLFDLEEGRYNIREPKLTCPKVSDFSNTLCIMPALAADRKGTRLGYGKGYYDRFLSKNPEIYKLLPIYDELLVFDLAKDTFDKKADFIVTPKESIEINED